MLNSKLSRAWNTWRSDAASETRVKTFVSKMLNRKLLAGLLSWREQATLGSNRDRKVRGYLTRMLKQKLHQGWNTWLERWLHNKQTLVRMRKVLTKWTNRRLSACWGMWHDQVKNGRDQMFKLQKALAKFCQGTLMAAMQSWRAECRKVREQRFKLRGFLTRVAKGKLSMAWSTWRDQHSSDGSVRKMMLKFLNARLSAAFVSWRNDTGTQTRNQLLASKMLRRVCQHKLQSAWVTWNSFATEAKLEGMRLSRAMARITQLRLARSFDSLNDHVAAQKVTTRARHRISKHITSVNFHIWHFIFQTVRELNVDSEKRAWRADHAYHWITRCRQEAMLKDLSHNAAAAKRTEHLMQRAVVHSRRRAFFGWLSSKREARHQLSCLRMGIKHSTRLALRVLGMSSHRRKVSALQMRRAEKAHNKAQTKSALQGWVWECQQEKRAERQNRRKQGVALIVAGLGRADLNCVESCWQHLTASSKTRKVQLGWAQQAIEHAFRVKRSQVLAQWKLVWHQELGSIANTQMAVAHALGHLKQPLLQDWRYWLQSNKFELGATERSIEWNLRRLRVRALRHFVVVSRSTRRQQRAAPVGIKHCCVKTLQRMDKWTKKAVRRDRRTTQLAMEKAAYFERCRQALAFWGWRERYCDRQEVRVRAAGAFMFMANRRRALGFWELRAIAADFRAADYGVLTVEY